MCGIDILYPSTDLDYHYVVPRDGEDGFFSTSTFDAECHDYYSPAITVGRFITGVVYPYMAQSVSK